MAKKISRAGCCGSGVRGKSIVRTASKTMEKQIVSSAQRLYENPLLILPDYQDNVSKKSFKKLSSQLSKIEQQKDDVKKLERIAKKQSIPSAVAGTLLIAHSKKTPFLASAQYSTESVFYAQRGNASKEYLIAAQHTNNPFFRLFGIRDIAWKHRLHIYSWDTGFLSTGLVAQPPKGFIDYIFKTVGYSVQKNNVVCQHLSSKILEQRNTIEKPYLMVHWNSADVSIGICEHCTSKKTNIIFSITKYMIEPDIREDFTVSIIGEVIKKGDKDKEYETMFLEDYFNGVLSDHQLIQKNMENRVEKLRNSEMINYILDGNSFGDDANSFIDSLKPTDIERKALRFFLKNSSRSVVVSDATPNMVMEMFWSEHGKDFLITLLDDVETVEHLYSLHETPSVIVKTAAQLQKRRMVLQRLPQYSNLPSIPYFVDSLTRIYKTEGIDKMIAAVKQRPDTPQGKAMAYAFLQAVGKAQEEKWRFSKIEVESGEFLTPYVKRLLLEDPDSYHSVFQELLKASGSSEILDSYRVE
ncbi:MAG: hypothetical protein QCI00_00225 [Candidatus Thermoplasmatota archaeon]|nr:hypothetical protein [Candidatus Thermoplasmatota archaeon]